MTRKRVDSRAMRFVPVLVLAAVVTAPLARAAAPSDFLDRYAATRGFRSGQPTAITIPKGGGQVLFLRSVTISRSLPVFVSNAHSEIGRAHV